MIPCHHLRQRSARTAPGSVCIVWGTTYLATRVALETIPPALIGVLRFTAAGAILMVWLRARGHHLPEASQWSSLALVGFLLLVVGNGGGVAIVRTRPR